MGLYLGIDVGSTSLSMVVLDVATWVTLALILYSGFHYLFHAARMVRDEGPEPSHPG